MEPEENIVLVFKYAITLIYVDRGGKKTWTYLVVNLHLSDTVLSNI